MEEYGRYLTFEIIEVFKFRLSWQTCLICLIFLPNWKNCGCQMVIHLSIIHDLGCFTSVIWPFILTPFWVMFVLCKCQPLQGCVNFFSQRDNWIPKLNASLAHNTCMRQQQGQWSDHWNYVTKTVYNTKMGNHWGSIFPVWQKY